MKTLTTALLLLFSLSSVVMAGEWKGQVTERDGLKVVVSPTTGYEPNQRITPKQLWSVGNDEDNENELFGFIADLTLDDDGNCYLVDSQLHVIRVFSPDGKFLRAFGRQGAGPGEFSYPSSLVFLSHDLVGTFQSHPSRLVLFTTAGDAAGIMTLSLEHHEGMVSLVGSKSWHGNIYLHGLGSVVERGQTYRTYFCDQLDSKGRFVRTLYTCEEVIERAENVVDDSILLPFLSRQWAVCSDGSLVLYGSDQYEITVCNLDGTHYAITRDYQRRKRSRSEIERKTQSWLDSYMSTEPPKLNISDYDPDVFGLYPQADGTLWVLTSHGTADRPRGAMGVFDVFDQRGRFQKQVTLMGRHDPLDDEFYFFGKRLYVVTKLESTMSHLSRGDSDYEPMMVYCFLLP